nr:transglutaminase-like domain-containing protein [Limnobacter humi]
MASVYWWFKLFSRCRSVLIHYNLFLWLALHVSQALANGAIQGQASLHEKFAHPPVISSTVGDEASATLLNEVVQGAKSDYEKAHRIYRWVIKNMSHDPRAASRIGDPARHALSQLLTSRRGSCAVFADVTSRLMVLAGLNVRTVEGVARVGTARRGQANHRWNEVWLDGEWRVVDTTWGAGYLEGGRFVRDNTDLFFAMPAELAKLSHYPLRYWGGYASGEESTVVAGGQSRLAFNTFTKLSEQAIFMAAAGFSADDLLRAAVHGSAQPDWYQPLNTQTKVIQAPVSKVLAPSAEVRFQFENQAYEEMAVVQGRKWVRQRAKTGLFDLAVSALPGELLVMGRRKGQDEFEAVLGYQVGGR